MKNVRNTISALMFIILSAVTATSAEAVCTETGFFRDGINMTAALINPATVTSPVNAEGCNIGVYYDNGTATLNTVDIYGANYFGVAVNGDVNPVVVNFTNNIIHNIGEVPFNGTQHGIGIYLRAFFTSNVTGVINNNTVFAYQKGGIVVNGIGAKLSQLNGNEVHGLGHVDFIAQNGIQIGYGAMPFPGEIINNRVTGNSYIGTPGDGSSSGGILLVGGPGYGVCPDGNDCPYTVSVLIGVNSTFTQVGPNRLFNNDVGVYASNLAADFSSSPTPTGVIILGNVAGSDRCFNPYQAGISDQGHTDYIIGNYILQGGGYGPACGIGIDVTGSNNPQVIGNNVPATGASARRTGTTIKVVPVKP